MEFFLNPWYMAAGGALVSSPVIIHLINRMRFKRIRWAAMEFLLKSQKRNRRRLIIEQLILLLLRILMVLLVALLVARWIYGGSTSSTGTAHVVILDDTPSMRDAWVDQQGAGHTAWSVGRAQIMLLAKNAALANSAQEMKIVLLSDLEHPIFEKRLSDKSEEEIGKLLSDKKPTFLHLPPLPGLDKGYEYLHSAPQGQKILHFVSDFRESDWDNGPDVEKIKAKIDLMLKDQINLSLIDTANPSRTVNPVAPGDQNVAVLDVKPSSRIVAEGVDVVFTTTLFNYSKSEVTDIQFDMLVNETEKYEAHDTIARIQPGQRLEKKVSLIFTKVKNGPEYARVRSRIKVKNPANNTLDFDDARDVIVDVRKKVPILLVDGMNVLVDNLLSGLSEEEKKDPEKVAAKLEEKYPNLYSSDYRILSKGLEAGRSYIPIQTTVEQLAHLDLDDYPTIYLLDVPPIANPAIVDKLQKYVEQGGCLVYFLGPKTKATFLNEEMHVKRKGLFPILLNPAPVDLLGVLLENQDRRAQLKDWIAANEGKKEPTEDDLKRLMRRVWIQGWEPGDDKLPADKRPLRVLQGKILFRDPKNPIVSPDVYGLAKVPTYYYDNLLIAHYFQPGVTSEWAVPPAEVTPVITMPQIRSSIDQFKEKAQEYPQKALELTKEIAATDPDFAKHEDAVAGYGKLILKALRDGSIPVLDLALERFMEERGDEKNPDKPDMPKLWDHPKMKDLKAKMTQLRDAVRFGDPLVVSRKYTGIDGKNERGGLVVAVLTTAGTAGKAGAADTERWNEWGSGPALWSYPIFISRMQAYLSSQGDSYNRVLSADPAENTVEVAFPKDRYQNDMKVKFYPQEQPKAVEGQPAPLLKPKDLPPRRLAVKDDHLLFSFADAKEPGFYTFDLTPLKGGEADVLALAYNVDAKRESNLARTASEKLQRPETDKDSRKGKVMLISPGDSFEGFKNREPDVSERPWIYLIALLILIAEQAMAVHLSFHLKSSDAHAPSPARAAA